VEKEHTLVSSISYTSSLPRPPASHLDLEDQIGLRGLKKGRVEEAFGRALSHDS
jgi:hypothetical protein